MPKQQQNTKREMTMQSLFSGTDNFRHILHRMTGLRGLLTLAFILYAMSVSTSMSGSISEMVLAGVTSVIAKMTARFRSVPAQA